VPGERLAAHDHHPADQPAITATIPLASIALTMKWYSRSG